MRRSLGPSSARSPWSSPRPRRIRSRWRAGKRDTGERLGNVALRTEARVTVIDGALAVGVLAGVALNTAAAWWWADPISALVILGHGLREARHAWAESARA